MKITEQPDLAKWPSTLLDMPQGGYSYTSYLHFVEGVQHTRHGTVEIQSWETRPNSELAQVPDSALFKTAALAKGIRYTRLRIVIEGRGWQYEEAENYPPPRLARLAVAFANVAREAAGAQQQFVNDGAGLVTLAINFARELSPDGVADPQISDNVGGAFVGSATQAWQPPSADKLAAFGYEGD